MCNEARGVSSHQLGYEIASSAPTGIAGRSAIRTFEPFLQCSTMRAQCVIKLHSPLSGHIAEFKESWSTLTNLNRLVP